MDSSIIVRPATTADLEAVNEINNHYIVQTHFTMDLEPISIEKRKEWFSQFNSTRPYRLLVASDGEGKVLGYACSSSWNKKPGYDTSVETTVYVRPGYYGRSIGKKLYTALFEALKDQDLHRAYAGLALPNDASVKLHEKFGFYRVAYYTEAGRKFDRYWDVAWFEKKL